MQDIERRISAGQGSIQADLVIENVRLLDLVSGALTTTDIAIVGDRIVGTYGTYTAERVIDGNQRIAVPGFIDTHLHVETTLLTPLEFDRCVLPHGITTIFCDPHEIANVLGVEGIEWFLDASERTIMDLRVNLSSCVPATRFERSGASIGAEDLVPLLKHPKAHGLAEVMDYGGVLSLEPGVIAKLEAFQDRHMDGHAPLLRGMGLNGYLASGISTDHEVTGPDEALEKIRKGMSVLIREGSASKDLEALKGVLSAETSAFIALCTDDRSPLDIEEEGHIDSMIRRLIAAGCPAHHVYRSASLSAARIFGLRDRGFVAPGWRADIVLLDDLEACSVSDVICGGRLVTADLFAARGTQDPIGLASMKRGPVAEDLFHYHPRSGENETAVIGVKAGLLITSRETASLARTAAGLIADPKQDVLKAAVIERHGGTERGLAFVTGFGLTAGALASSVGHDSHNLAVVGANDSDMMTAANRVIALGGGLVAVKDGKVLAELALPIAGLMSTLPFEEIVPRLRELLEAARGLGSTLPDPFLQLAFLALPVIPHLKLTPQGLFDVDASSYLTPPGVAPA